MIVVLIIGILLAIAVPNFITARQNSRIQTVIGNLKQIQSAKEQWAMANGQVATAVPVSTDLTPTYMKAWPTGPVTGTYTANAVSADPTFAGQTLTQFQDPTQVAAAAAAAGL